MRKFVKKKKTSAFFQTLFFTSASNKTIVAKGVN